ncbi:MAG: Ig-like domain-containing protein [Treponema sp.]|nr:Ig-like domain-containing protein [Treponema sp.]
MEGKTSEDGSLYEGQWQIFAQAIDKAGNESAVESRTFWIDQKDPLISLDDEKSLVTNKSFILTGSAEDSYGLDSTNPVVISNGKNSWTVIPSADKKWSRTFEVGSGKDVEDGEYTFTATVKDKAGKTSKTTKSVIVDSTAPTLTNNKTQLSVHLDESKYLSLSTTVSDGDGYSTGINGVFYKLTSTNEAPVYQLNGNSWESMAKNASGYSANFDITSIENGLSEDGTVYAWFATSDGAENIVVCSTPSVIIVDKSLPVITVYNDTDLTSQITDIINSNIVSVTVYALVADTNVKELVSDDSTAIIGTPVAVQNGKKYPVTFTATDAGSQIKLKARDTNERESKEITVSAKCDLVRPQISFTSEQGTNADSNNCRKYDTLKITGTVTEPNLNEVVVYLAKNGTTEYRETAGTTKITNGVYTFTANFSGIADGVYTVKVDASDTYGNNTDGSDGKPASTTELQIVKIDTTAPTVGELVANPTSVNISTKNDSQPFTISAMVTDSTSGISVNTVKLYDNNADTGLIPTASNGTYTFTLNKNTVTTGTHTYKISATDLAGNTSSKETTVHVDVTAPVVTVNGVSPIVLVGDSEKVNGIITVSGSISDETELSSVVTYAIYEGETLKLSNNATVSGTITSKNWIFSIDTTELTATTGAYTIKVTGSDAAENPHTATYNISVDQSTDKPDISLSNVKDNTLVANWNAITDGNTNVFAPGGRIIATISDDDGIGSVLVSITPEGAAQDADFVPLTVTGTPVLYNLSYDLPSEEGAYKITFKVIDTKEETESKSATSTMFVAVDSGAPSFSSMTADGGYYKNQLAVSGIVKDGSNKVSIIKSAGTGVSGNYTSAVNENNAATGAALSDNLDISSASLTDGQYTVTYEAKDRWGKASLYVVTFNKDNTAPVYDAEKAPRITNDLAPIDGATVINIANPSATISASAKDTGTGMSRVYYTMDSSTEQHNLTAHGSDYSATIDFSASTYAEGAHTIKVYAEDTLGNTTTPTLLSLFKDVTKPEATLVLKDVSSEPAVIQAYDLKGDLVDVVWNKTYYINTSFALTGVINEANFGTAIIKDDALTPAFDSIDENGTSRKWKFTKSVDTENHTDDAVHQFILELADKYGNTNSYTIKFDVDTNPPKENTITSPSEDKIAEKALEDSTFVFKGKAWELSTDGSGVAKIWYIFSKNPTAPAGNEGYTSMAAANKEEWSITKEIGNGTTPEDDKLSEGIWYLHVKAQDTAGNLSAAETRTVEFDKAKPSLTVTEASVNNWTTTATNPIRSLVTTNAESGAKTLTLSGTITESNALRIVTESSKPVEVTVDGVSTYVTVSGNFTGNSKTWQATIPVGSETGKLLENAPTVIHIKVVDIANKYSDISYTLFYDTLAPELAISAPTEGEPVDTNSKTIKGTVSDDGFGLEKLEFELRNINDSESTIVKDNNGKDIKGLWLASGTAETNNYPLTIKGEQWYYAGNTQNATSIPLGSTKGKLQLYVKATEKASGNETAKTTESTIDFFYDEALPTITETSVGTGEKVTNAAVTLSGAVSDDWMLDENAAITIAVDPTSEDSNVWKTISKSVIDASAGGNQWTHTLDVGNGEFKLSDGSHTVVITAKDASGKTNNQTRYLKIDTQKPAAPTDSTVYTDLYNDGTANWFKTRSVAVSVKSTDTADANYNSGLSQLQYTKDSPSKTTRTWENMVVENGVGTTTIAFDSDGQKTIYFKAVDVAKNESTETPLNFYIDATAPETCTLLTLDGKTDNISNGKYAGSKLVGTGTEKITFTTKISDATTGVASVKVTSIGSTSKNITGTGDENGVYTIEIAKADFATGDVTLTVADKAGNSKEYPLFQINNDNTYPKTTFGTIRDDDSKTDGIQVNGTITLSGTSSDDNGKFKAVELQRWDSTANSNDGAWVTYNAGSATQPANWSFTVDTTEFTNGSTQYFRVLATDEADNKGNTGNGNAVGNTAADYQVALIINQDTDRPVLRLNNLTLTNAGTATGYWWHAFSQLYGSVSDDDGAVRAVYYSLGDAEHWVTEPVIGADGNPEKDEEGNDKTQLKNILVNGIWSIDGLDDGTEDVYFKVVDAEGHTFVSNTTSTTWDSTNSSATSEPWGGFGPKIDDNASNKKYGYSGSEDDILKLQIDITAPVIGNTKYYASNTGTYAEPETWGDIGDLALNPIGGSGKQYLFVKYTAQDTNGIKETSAKLGSTEGTVVGTTTNDGTREIKTVRFDLGSVETKTHKLTITAVDNATKSGENNYNIIVDNANPIVTITSPTRNGTTLYGTASNTFVASISDTNDIEKIYYFVTNSTYTPETVKANTFTEVKGGDTWTMMFDGGTGDGHAPLLTETLRQLLGKTKAEMDTYDTDTTMYLWMYAEDELENTGDPVMVRSFTVIPNGDKPTLGITYPTNWDTVGGTLRVTGSATIQTDEVEAVYIQIDTTTAKDDVTGKTATFIDGDWKTPLETLKTNKNIPDSNWKIESTGLASPYDYGIKVTGTTSWSQNLNMYQEFDSLENKAITIRAFAKSKTRKTLSNVETTSVIIDPDSPKFGSSKPLQLVQYDSDGKISARQDYSDDMFIKGKWYLTGSIEDDSGIKLVTVKKESVTVKETNGVGNKTTNEKTDTVVDDGTIKADFTQQIEENSNYSSSTSYKNYDLNLEIGDETNDYGTLKYTITIQEGGGQNSSKPMTFSFNFDNKAPSSKVIKSSKGTAPTDLTYDSSNDFFRISQEEGTYTIQGEVDEEGDGVNQSGFERVVMYYTRTIKEKVDGDDTDVTYIVDPMLSSGGTGRENWEKVETFGNTENGLYWRSGKGYVENNILYVDKLGDESVTTLPDTVRFGGLCSIDNIIYRIDYVDGIQIGLAGSLQNTRQTGDSSTLVDVKFAVAALVVDNTVSESGKTDTYDKSKSHASTKKDDVTGTNGDGDQMVEEAIKSGAKYSWAASIKSTNILDGHVKLHIVAFDKAGNFNDTVAFEADVSNNTPRVAGVAYGSDSNGNDVVESSEMINEYSGVYSTFEKAKTTWEIKDEDKLTVKSGIVVKPEIIGGNTSLGYTYSFTKTDSTAYKTKLIRYKTTTDPSDSVEKYTYEEDGIKKYEGTHNDGTVVRKADLSIPVTLEDMLENSIANGENKMVFTIWDETEGSVMGENSGYATVTLETDVQIDDTKAPTNSLKRFMWQNSLNNSVKFEYDSYGEPTTALGHIELETNWTPITTEDAELNKVYDSDPKVSGIIKLEGIAEDNSCVEKLAIIIPGINRDSEIVFAQRDRTEKSATLGQIVGTGKTLETDGIEFIVATDNFDKKSGANTVNWSIWVDTQKLSTVTATDVAVRAIAYDRGSPSWNTTNNKVEYPASAYDEATNNKGYRVNGYAAETASTGLGTEVSPYTCMYKMDVVPYITAIKRNSGFITNRTRSGAIPLLRGEAGNIIEGFNLAATVNNTATEITLNTKRDGSGTANGTIATIAPNGDGNLTFTIPAEAKSGYVQLKVNDIPALNNINANVSYNVEKNAKAFDHNTLTDDRYIQVWRVSKQDTFKGSLYCNYPAMSKNPVDNVLYASFTNYGQSKSYYSKAFIGDSAVAKETSASATGDVTTIFFGYDPPENTDISVGADGKVNVFINANYHGGKDTSWDGYAASSAGGIYVYDQTVPTLSYNTNTGGVAHRLARFELYTYDNELNQFKNMRVNRTVVNGVPYSNVVYYDRLTNAVKYSYLPMTTDKVWTVDAEVTFTYNNKNGWTASNTTNYNGKYVEIDGNHYTLKRNGSYGSYYYTVNNYNGTVSTITNTWKEVVLNDTSSGSAGWVVIDGDSDDLDKTGIDKNYNNTKISFAGGWSKPVVLTDDRYEQENNSGENSSDNNNQQGSDNNNVSRTDGTGESIALTATNTGMAVILYMDAATGQLRIARANSVTPNAVTNWKVQGVFASSDANYETASDYMSCAVDSDGYLHIAFQNTKGQLVYAISTNNPDDGNTAYTFGSSEVLDDSGMWIDITMDGTTPYISYLSKINSLDGMKIAYKNPSLFIEGDPEANGGWETMTAPMPEKSKVTNVRSCIEVKAKAWDEKTYQAAIGFCPGEDYRAAFFVGE